MEPPTSAEPDALRDEKTKVLRVMRRLGPADVVRGQYDGYLEERDVAAHSMTETFRDPPRLLFCGDDGHQPRPNRLRFRLSHDDGVTLSVQAKQPGEELCSHPVDLDVSFPQVFGERKGAYERLLGDAIEGLPSRFAGEAGVEAAWKVVEPILHDPDPLHRYPRGSWGPPEAARLIEPYGQWFDP